MFGRNTRFILLSGTAAFAGIGSAHAAGTQAGTVINNTASVSYSVNGTTTTTNSTTATFVVDRKVNFTVITDQAAYTQVNLSEAGAVTSFKVTNTTNGTQDFLLDPDQTFLSLGLAGTDNFNMLNLRVYVDSNRNNVYDPGVDTQQFIDELAADTSIEVFIVGDAPATAGAALAFVNLHVTAAAGGGATVQGVPLAETINLANADSTTDIVFADDDNDGTTNLGDIARNGQGRAYAAYEVGTRTVNLTVSKTARVLTDGVNLINPKSLPGSTVEYCLTAVNATLLTPANNVVLTDIIPANMTYVPGTITIGAPGVPGVACNLLPAAQADATGYNAATRTVTATIPLLAGATSQAVAFQALIN